MLVWLAGRSSDGTALDEVSRSSALSLASISAGVSATWILTAVRYLMAGQAMFKYADARFGRADR
jgi:hypothetical protein